MIQPASFFSSITPVKAYASDSMSLSDARAKFRPTGTTQPLLERIAREPQVKRDNLDARHEGNGEQSHKVQDFIDTILTNGEFLPVTDAPFEPGFLQDGRSSQGQSYRSHPTGAEQGQTYPAASSPQTMASIRAAAEAWQQSEPQRTTTADLPTSIASYINVQSGGTPALGLSLFA